jgi:tetratricopeptide (TPR) repeat protein
MPEVAAAWGTLAGVLSVRRGELEALLPMIELAMHDWPDLPAIHASLASLYCELGRLDEARTLLDTAAANDFTDLPRDRIWLTAAASWADTAADLGAHRAASALYAELEPFAKQVVPPSLGAAEGPVAFHLGRLATSLTSYDDAETHFTEAAELCTQIGAHYWLCRNQLAHARMVRNRNGAGDPERVRKLLEEAREIAKREGYRHLEQQANRLLLG